MIIIIKRYLKISSAAVVIEASFIIVKFLRWCLSVVHSVYHLACFVNSDILKYFSYFPQKNGFKISCKMSS